MAFCRVNSGRGQLKIQQMAFVLVALMIFFGMVALFYFSIRISNLEKSAIDLKDEQAKELVRKLTSTAEFGFTASDCSGCVDLDKVLILKERETYKDFWQLDYLEVEKITGGEECTKANYPECGKVTIIKKENYGAAVSSFVSLCRWEKEKGGYTRCELGKILVSGKGIK